MSLTAHIAIAASGQLVPRNIPAVHGDIMNFMFAIATPLISLIFSGPCGLLLG